MVSRFDKHNLTRKTARKASRLHDVDNAVGRARRVDPCVGLFLFAPCVGRFFVLPSGPLRGFGPCRSLRGAFVFPSEPLRGFAPWSLPAWCVCLSEWTPASEEDLCVGLLLGRSLREAFVFPSGPVCSLSLPAWGVCFSMMCFLNSLHGTFVLQHLQIFF